MRTSPYVLEEVLKRPRLIGIAQFRTSELEIVKIGNALGLVSLEWRIRIDLAPKTQ